MKLIAVLLLGLLLFAAGTPDARAYTLSIDMDSTMAGIQPTISALPGSTITVTGFITSVTGGVTFDSVGFDLSWSKPGETGTLSPVAGSPKAGSLAGMGTPGLTIDLFSLGAVTTGTTLVPDFVSPPVGTNTLNLAGFGYQDLGFGSFFGGFGAPFGPPATTIDVFTMDFLVGGPVGGTVTVDPSGIFAPGFPFSPPLTVSGGAALYDVTTGTASPAAMISAGGAVVVVPEPSRALLGLLGFGAVLLRRRR